MTQIKIAAFCNKHGFTEHQIRHATRTGKLEKIAKGIVDEEVALQIIEPYRVCRRVNILRDYPDDKIKIYP